MRSIVARNVNDAYVDGLWWLKSAGLAEASRNGPVIVSPEPVCTEYTNPWERILFDEQRDANPFFHLAECVWMLAGSNEVDWLAQFNEGMKKYSDNGKYFHGAYGHRWRSWFGKDQLTILIELLREDPNTRRAVLAMWDPRVDLARDTKDLPCNTHIYFRKKADKLDMTVCCRSNDAVWGAYGANAVHFSFLQEFVALAVGLSVGTLYQFSNNFHIYEKHWPLMDAPALDINPYAEGDSMAVLLMNDGPKEWNAFLVDCETITSVTTSDRTPPIRSPFMFDVVWSMLTAYLTRKKGHREECDMILNNMVDCDWKMAGLQWVARRNNDKG